MASPLVDLGRPQYPVRGRPVSSAAASVALDAGLDAA